uniref:SOWAHA-C winged helix-turn-helix domain-containing protein n=1 Tax=Vombatus ursinus TaxID=29139 RepID=A0A4X2KE87_VOMUR
LEGMEELGQEAVLLFLTQRGGRARNAELVEHFRGALGGEPEQRARAREHFKQLVNAVATVRTDPADGTKYVYLKKKFCGGGPPPPLHEAPGSLDRANPATSNGPESPEGSAPPSAGDHPLPEGNPEESGPSADQESPPQLVSDSEPLPRNWEEGDNCSSPGGVSTPRPGRKNLLDLMIGSSPQLKRSFFVGGNNLGGSTGGGRATRGGGDSDTASLASSSNEEEGSATGSVALDPLEHAWMLSASDGKWDSLEGLLTCEPGLLAKRDFITGFTCLHWAAKHGKQELLAMLVNFANKHHLPVNINARTSAGYTALHLAAMHGHVEVVKLLVGAYDADVDIRDYSGKKASQYLNQSIAEEIKNLVGALEDDDGESTSDSGGGRWKLSKVLPSHLITYKLSHVPEDGGDHHHHHSLADGSAGGKSVSRKALGGSSNSSRMRPRLNKIRFRTQIIHSTPSFRDPEQPLSEEERSLKSSSSTSSFKLRPKSNVFG